uniref:Guanylyl cyclase n=1 Tax=Palpitomonas bilix TaxID=652834 RepID=A0A7S3FZJ0_9EUKA|mmetsp:Transcript_16314/g.41354  ORF Transcript_16314/g.41354 Transcript_16314/m.41354 type:complete len:372 (+) Transcript_16314:241-1356(+)
MERMNRATTAGRFPFLLSFFLPIFLHPFLFYLSSLLQSVDPRSLRRSLSDKLKTTFDIEACDVVSSLKEVYPGVPIHSILPSRARSSREGGEREEKKEDRQEEKRKGGGGGKGGGRGGREEERGEVAEVEKEEEEGREEGRRVGKGMGRIPRAVVEKYEDVEHVHQMFDWDCGVACVCMLLMHFGVKDWPRWKLAAACGTESVWTSDLAILLERFSIPYKYYTVLAGVDRSHERKVFYKKEFSTDEMRVQQFFAKKRENVYVKQLKVDELKALCLHRGNMVILLVDAMRMTRARSALCSCVFLGHFILLIDYNEEEECFYAKDPGKRSPGLVRLHYTDVDRCRLANGTDEDMIVVNVKEGKEALSTFVQVQ